MHQFLPPCTHAHAISSLQPKHKIMQRHNLGALQPAPACAACKHQRKKCHETCPLAPYFPADQNREFQAVHKVFGVSNVTKMVKNVREEDRRKAVESLVWEAVCRQNDPVLGPFGEYKRVLEELKVCKMGQNQCQSSNPFVGQVGLPCFGGSINNNGNGIMGIINGGVNVNGSHLFNYLHDNLSAIIDSSPYSNSSTYNLQSPEKLMRLQQDKEISSSIVVPFQPPPQQQQQQHQHQHQHQHQQHPNFHHCF